METKISKISFHINNLKTEKEKIVISSRELFLKKGFSHTSMDEIARNLKISKKTIYKFFPSKKILLQETVVNFMETNNQLVQTIVSSNDNAVEKAYKLFNFIGVVLMNISENFISDLKNYAPNLWREIDKRRIKFLKENLTKIIIQGKEEGYFINESTSLIINTFISAIRGIVNPEIILRKNFSVEKTFKGSIKILMNGILTLKGKKVFKSLNIGANK